MAETIYQEPPTLPSFKNALENTANRTEKVPVTTSEGEIQNIRESSAMVNLNRVIGETVQAAEKEGNKDLAEKAKEFPNLIKYVGMQELDVASGTIAQRLYEISKNNKHIFIYDTGEGSSGFAAMQLQKKIDELARTNPEVRDRIKLISGKKDYILETGANPNAIVVFPDTLSVNGYQVSSQARLVNAEEVFGELQKMDLREEESAKDKIIEVSFVKENAQDLEKPWREISVYEIEPDTPVTGPFTSSPSYEDNIAEFHAFVDTHSEGFDYQPTYLAIPTHERAGASETVRTERQRKSQIARKSIRSALKSGGRATGAAIGSTLGGIGTAVGSWIGGGIGDFLDDPIGWSKKWARRVAFGVLAGLSILTSYIFAIVIELAVYLLIFVVFVIFVLFIINSGAYIVPPGGFGQVPAQLGPGDVLCGQYNGRNYCFPVAPVSSVFATCAHHDYVATDIITSAGVPAPLVVAVTDGEILYAAGTDPTAGNAIIQLGDDNYIYGYFHLASINIQAGARVTAGQQMGIQGSSGNAVGTDPHTHFQAIHISHCPFPSSPAACASTYDSTCLGSGGTRSDCVLPWVDHYTCPSRMFAQIFGSAFSCGPDIANAGCGGPPPAATCYGRPQCTQEPFTPG